MRILKLLIYRLLIPLDGAAKWLVPASTRRVCYFGFPDYSDNAFYQFRHLLTTREHLEHIWLVQDTAIAARIRRESAELAQASHSRVRVVRKRSLRGYIGYLTSKTSFHTHGVFPFSRIAAGRSIVCLWHGMPIKCIGRLNHISPNPNPTTGTLHVATSHFFKYIIAAAFAAEPKDVLVSGLPRCDALRFDECRQTGNAGIRKLLDIPADDKLVLWMPTYRTEVAAHHAGRARVRSFLDDLPAGLLDDIDAAGAANGCRVLLKLHPFDRLNTANEMLAYDHIQLLKADDWQRLGAQLYDLIAASHALISDISSVLLDYLVTQRPIAIAGFDATTYNRDLVFPMPLLLRSERFQQLTGAASAQQFFAGVGRDDTSIPDNDISHMFNEPLIDKSAEIIARAAGL